MKGRMTISRIQSNRNEELPIRIRVVDEGSMTAFLDVHLSLEALSLALTGQSDIECEFELRPKLVGKQREHKTELVPFPRDQHYVEKSERAAVASRVFAPFEVDGWKGSVDDLFNHHRQEGDCMRVLFTRYVDPEAD